MKHKIAFALFVFALLPACTRTAEKTALVDAPVVLGPTTGDSQVPLLPPPAETLQAALQMEKEMDTASYLRMAEDIQAISLSQNNPKISQLSRELVETYRGESASKTSFSKSLYAQTMIGEGEPEVMKQLEVVSRDLRHAINAIVGLLDRSKTSFSWPKRITSFSQAIDTADRYTTWLGEKIPELDLSPEMARPLRGAIKGEYARLRPVIVDYASRIEGAKSFSEAVFYLKSAIGKFKVKLDKKTAADFARADELVTAIANTSSSQDALTLIILVWRSIPPGEREAVFKEAAPEFYDFLNGKDEASLDCLASTLCLNPILGAAKQLVILPKIAEFGVEKIRRQIDSAARDQLIGTVLELAGDMLPQIPELIKEQALAEAQKYKNLIALVKKDFAGFAKNAFRSWEKENFTTAVGGLDPSQVKIRIRGQGKVRVALPNEGKSGVTSGAEVLGVSLALAHEFLPEKGRNDLKAALLEPIVKVLAVTGFRQSGGKLFPSLLLPLEGKRSEIFNIKNLLQGRTSYAVPDSFVAGRDMIMNRQKSEPNASVRAQAELLRGMSRQIKFHRDWERNTFDEKLGDIPVEDLVKDIPKGSVNFSAFPKEMIFTLAVGGAGAILQNVVRDLSPAFLMLPNGTMIWGDKYKEIGEGDGNVSTVAGLVDIENGKRGHLVQTADVARYILALDEFLSATEGIEQTKSPQLNAVGENGRTVLEELQDARRYLRLFQLALTNYLVYVAQDKDGSFRSIYDLDTKTMVSSQILLSDQALAIRALMASAKQLNLNLFSWAALDGFYFMNRKMWDKERQFYGKLYSPEGGWLTGEAALPEIALMIRAGEDLSPLMKDESRRQWNRITQPWLRALEEF